MESPRQECWREVRFNHNYHLDGPVPNLDQSVSGKCSKNSSTKFRGCGPQGFKVSKDSAGTPVGWNVFHNGVVKKIATKARCSGKMFQDCCKMVVWWEGTLKWILLLHSLMETYWTPVKQMLCGDPCQTQMINHASCIRLTVGRSAWSTDMTARVPVPQSGPPASFSPQAPIATLGQRPPFLYLQLDLSIWGEHKTCPKSNNPPGTIPESLSPSAGKRIDFHRKRLESLPWAASA